MIKILAALFAMFAFTAGAEAQTDTTVWQGNLFFTSATETCITNGVIAPDNFALAIYRPNLNGAHAQEGLSFVFPRSAFVVIAAGANGSLRGKATAIGSFIGAHATLSGEYPTTVDLTITPRAITATTPLVQISGTINNFFDVVGCNATISSAMLPRP